MKEPIEREWRGAGRVAFLANQDKIAADLKSGYTVRKVYDQIENRLCISYSQFTRYVNKYIRVNSNDGLGPHKKTEVKTKPPEIKATKKEKVPFFDSKGGHNSDGLI